MNRQERVLVTTVPFGELDEQPIRILREVGLEVVLNPLGKKLRSTELAELISDFDYLIAGTEVIDAAVIEQAKRLKLIARVGIGLDGLDLLAARAKGIPVTYTPDAPSDAVAELTIGLMISCLRQLHVANQRMHSGQWHRHFGRRFENCTVGLLGLGRIGSRVARLLEPFRPKVILGHDLRPLESLELPPGIVPASFEQVINESDLLSIHVPLTESTRQLIGSTELSRMRFGSMIVNTARGGIVDEGALLEALTSGHIATAALDVFTEEPYSGPLRTLENAVLTSHMGSMSVDSRFRMELEAATEVQRLVSGAGLRQLVPESEYALKEIELS